MSPSRKPASTVIACRYSCSVTKSRSRLWHYTNPLWSNMAVLLTGTYSSHNKGDLAMQLTAARLLSEQGVEVVSSVPFPDLDRPAYAAAGVEIVSSNRRKLIRASWQLARLGLWRLLGRRPRWLVNDANLAGFRDADVVIDLSGDMLTEDYGPHVAYSHFVPLLKALLLDRPLIILAQSIGPFRWTKGLAKAILRRAALITVRDPLSRSYLVELGLEPPTVTADLAFALKAASRINNGPAPLISPAGAPVLGVSISALTASHHRRRAEGHDFYAEVAAALDGFASRHSAEIVFVPHVTGPSEAKDDRVAAERVRELMDHESHAVRADLSPADVKALIAGTSWFLGCRMHANIAALSSRVPTVAIAYSHKTPGIMERLGLDEYVLDVSQVTRSTLNNSLDRLVASSDSVRAHLEKVLPDVELAAKRNVELTMDHLKGRTT